MSAFIYRIESKEASEGRGGVLIGPFKDVQAAREFYVNPEPVDGGYVDITVISDETCDMTPEEYQAHEAQFDDEVSLT